MNWLVIPIDNLKQFDKDWEVRVKNIAKTEAILHEEIYNLLVPQVLYLELEEIKYPFTLLDRLGITDLMNTKEWKTITE